MPDKIAEYFVRNMRPVLTIGKVKASNPDRLMTIHGDFFAVDAKGKPTGDPLTFHSKEITQEIAANPVTVIDVENGRLVLPAGERGRKALAGIDADTVAALLAAARGETDAEGESNAEGESEGEPDAENAENVAAN